MGHSIGTQRVYPLFHLDLEISLLFSAFCPFRKGNIKVDGIL